MESPSDAESNAVPQDGLLAKCVWADAVPVRGLYFGVSRVFTVPLALPKSIWPA